ncbi:MAG: hypothetical protein OEL20_04770 [Sulfuritalea sp.]|nr:hypothetical protein [Sulfuritalea sp.]
MTQMVRYYRIPSGRNAGFAVVFGEWPGRVLAHRGWTPQRCVTERVATQEEHDWLAGCMRHQAYRYPTLAGLLEDEAGILDPAQLARIACALQLPDAAPGHSITG